MAFDPRPSAAGYPGGPQTGGDLSSQFFDPGMIQQLMSSIGGTAQQAEGQYMPFVSNPTASPLFQNQLSGLMGALGPSEKQARTGLGDQFRAAGNMASGQFGQASGNLESDILRNRQTMASGLLGQIFPQMTSALQAPMNQVSLLLNALRKLPQGMVGSGGAGGGGGIGGDPFNQLNDPNFQVGNLQNPFGPNYGMPPGSGGGGGNIDVNQLMQTMGGGASMGGSGTGQSVYQQYINSLGYDPMSAMANAPGIGLSGGAGSSSGFSQDPTTGMWTNPQPFDINNLMNTLGMMAPGGGID